MKGLVAKWGLELLAGLLLLGVALILLWNFDPFGRRQRAETKAAIAHAGQVQAEGQAKAGTAAATIADGGRRRDELTVTIHTDNEHAIQTAPGAAAGVDPGLNRVGRRGLCEYRAYEHDPACAELRRADPAELPPAG